MSAQLVDELHADHAKLCDLPVKLQLLRVSCNREGMDVAMLPGSGP